MGSRFPRPEEFWRVIAEGENYRRERNYKGPGGKKKCYDFAEHAKRHGATSVLIEVSKPKWCIDYTWKSC